MKGSDRTTVIKRTDEVVSVLMENVNQALFIVSVR